MGLGHLPVDLDAGIRDLFSLIGSDVDRVCENFVLGFVRVLFLVDGRGKVHVAVFRAGKGCFRLTGCDAGAEVHNVQAVEQVRQAALQSFGDHDVHGADGLAESAVSIRVRLAWHLEGGLGHNFVYGVDQIVLSRGDIATWVVARKELAHFSGFNVSHSHVASHYEVISFEVVVVPGLEPERDNVTFRPRGVQIGTQSDADGLLRGFAWQQDHFSVQGQIAHLLVKVNSFICERFVVDVLVLLDFFNDG